MWTLLDILSILCNLLDCRGSHERTTLSAVPKCNSASEQVLSGRYMQSEILEQLRQARLMAIMLYSSKILPACLRSSTCHLVWAGHAALFVGDLSQDR